MTTAASRVSNQGLTTVRRTKCPLRGMARLAVVLEIFLGLGAILGGGAFMLAPDGHLIGATTSPLAGTPFHSYLVPGIILFVFVGILPLLAAMSALRRQASAPLAAVGVGLTLIGWISVEMAMLAGLAALAWAFYLVLGTSIAALGIVWWRSTQRTPSRAAES
jgi:hypothetical protein